jgi:hypothetical protein
VWRYFRHTWSLEYRPTPGRGLQLLIRNAARPGWPVMGIAALANAVPLLKVRDLWIGWTLEGIRHRLEADPDLWGQVRPALLKVLAEARSAVRDDDLLALGRGADLESMAKNCDHTCS